MSKIKMDLKTAKWIADKAQNDLSVFPIEMAECEKCGAVYLSELGHSCEKVIELEFHDVEETEHED